MIITMRYNTLSFPFNTWVHKPEDFESELNLPINEKTSIKVESAANRLLSAIDPQLISRDRAHGSKNAIYRGLCAIYYASRRFLVELMNPNFIQRPLTLKKTVEAFRIAQALPKLAPQPPKMVTLAPPLPSAGCLNTALTLCCSNPEVAEKTALCMDKTSSLFSNYIVCGCFRA